MELWGRWGGCRPQPRRRSFTATHTHHATFGLFSINRKVGSSASLYEQTNKKETSSFLRVIERRTF